MAHDHGHTKKIGWTIVLNLIITVSEYLGGIFSGSLALLSDAGHNLSDVLSLILGYLGERISHKKETKEHTFGFKRTEVFTALINALLLWGISVAIIIEAIKRFGGNQEISLGLMIGVGSIGLFGNVFSVMILNKEKNKNVNMRSAYLHLFYDAISAVGVILTAIIIYYTKFYALDIFVSIAISLMIFWGGVGVIKESLHIFMQGVPKGMLFDDVYQNIKEVRGVQSIHNLHVWSINSEESFLSCHVCIDGNVKRTDDLIKRITKLLREKYHVEHTAIQIEKDNICKAETEPAD